MFAAKCRIVGIVLLSVSCAMASSQAVESANQAPSVSARGTDEVPRVPGLSRLFQGFNAGISYFGVHNSSVGWYSVATPGISYTFSPHYSADASASIYLHRMVENFNPGVSPTQSLTLDAVDAGDTFLGFHAAYRPEKFDDIISAFLVLPSGNSSEGLGTGRVTFDFTNHAERYYKRVGFLLDVGVGDSSAVSNNIITKNYSSLGALAHFQASTVLWVKGNYVETFAYEQLPVGSQTVYTSFQQGAGSNPAPTISGTGASEDNGLTLVTGIPLTSKVTFLSYYSRSLRRHSDTVSFGLTYVLLGSHRGKWLSLVDRALREAETDKQH